MSALNMIVREEVVNHKSTPLKIFAICAGFVVSNLRGTSEEQRSGWDKAGDPRVSGQTILGVILGKRDADVGKLIGKLIDKDGVYPC
ncbi:MAG: hypothetical protein M1828_001351 [Chrysothrix sp. TS-e1954]|nr:MAG: hypothetical protein M1828_001351 [Chrysothrix sp. TS-e1954]